MITLQMHLKAKSTYSNLLEKLFSYKTLIHPGLLAIPWNARISEIWLTQKFDYYNMGPKFSCSFTYLMAAFPWLTKQYPWMVKVKLPGKEGGNWEKRRHRIISWSKRNLGSCVGSLHSKGQPKGVISKSKPFWLRTSARIQKDVEDIIFWCFFF